MLVVFSLERSLVITGRARKDVTPIKLGFSVREIAEDNQSIPAAVTGCGEIPLFVFGDEEHGVDALNLFLDQAELRGRSGRSTVGVEQMHFTRIPAPVCMHLIIQGYSH